LSFIFLYLFFFVCRLKEKFERINMLYSLTGAGFQKVIYKRKPLFTENSAKNTTMQNTRMELLLRCLLISSGQKD